MDPRSTKKNSEGSESSMNQFLQSSKEEQKLVFDNTSDRLGVSSGIIEKDFWVCYILDYLFNHFGYKDSIYFKGGTSLSKVYQLIERFSEDIDLALDWQALGYDEDEPYLERSKRQQEIFNKQVNKDTAALINEIWIPQMKIDLERRLGDGFKIEIDAYDDQTINFRYPQLFEENSILQEIRIEVGALAEPIPSEFNTVTSYVSQQFPAIFNNSKVGLKSVTPLRTFFEKLLILHKEAHRSNANYPTRYSRHYYDVYQMLKTELRNESLGNIELLRDVVEFKKKFYPSNWAKYDNFYEGNLQLIPSEEAIEIFTQDYYQMQGMIFGETPTFEIIIDTLVQYNSELNGVLKRFDNENINV